MDRGKEGSREGENERKKWQPQIKFPSCQCRTEFNSVYWHPLASGKLHSEAEHGMNAHTPLNTCAHIYTCKRYCTQLCMSSGWCDHADKQFIPWGPFSICTVHACMCLCLSMCYLRNFVCVYILCACLSVNFSPSHEHFFFFWWTKV